MSSSGYSILVARKVRRYLCRQASLIYKSCQQSLHSWENFTYVLLSHSRAHSLQCRSENICTVKEALVRLLLTESIECSLISNADLEIPRKALLSHCWPASSDDSKRTLYKRKGGRNIESTSVLPMFEKLNHKRI